MLGHSPMVRGFVTHAQEKKMFSIARKNPAARVPCAALIRSLCVISLSVALAGDAFAQESASPHMGAASPLSDLLEEVEKNNPQIEAARQGWQAAKQVPTQVSTLPDPQFNLQHVSVGSPRPFAGYTNSDFAYLGLGVSQDIPYPGKLRLKGEIARRDADVSQQQIESVRRAVLAELKGTYFQLAYLSKTLTILEQDGALLKQVEQAADARYRSGMGTQQDVLQAQLQKTKLLREIAMHHLQFGKLEAQLKQLLNRSQESTDIEPADLLETPLVQSYADLLAAAQVQNPEIASAQKMTERQSLQVDLARKDFYPDFNVQYMWQRTELAQAESEQLRAQSALQAQSQQLAGDLRSQYVIVQQTSELLKIHREGLSPQARSEFQAGIAAYQSNKQDFQALLTAFLDVLHLDEDYWQNMAEYETAVARIEQLTGLSLHNEGAK